MATCCDVECSLSPIVVYYNQLSGNGLSLNRDAYPVCSTNSSPPEIISGTYNLNTSPYGCGLKFRFWRNIYSNCNSEQTTDVTTQTVVVTCTSGSIKVNGETLNSGGSKTFNTITFDPSRGAVPNSTLGEEIVVKNKCCPPQDSASFTITATLDWSTQRDHDLYGTVSCAVIGPCQSPFNCPGHKGSGGWCNCNCKCCPPCPCYTQFKFDCIQCIYEFCIVNSNFVKDNSWDIYFNNQFIGNYSGAPNTNICLPIPTNIVNNPGSNVLEFRLVSCTADDYFEFILRLRCGEEVTQLFSGNSGLLNESFFSNRTCDTTVFTRNVTLESVIPPANLGNLLTVDFTGCCMRLISQTGTSIKFVTIGCGRVSVSSSYVPPITVQINGETTTSKNVDDCEEVTITWDQECYYNFSYTLLPKCNTSSFIKIKNKSNGLEKIYLNKNKIINKIKQLRIRKLRR